MARKPHPADIANLAIIENAVRFDVALFLGLGRYATATGWTLDEARKEAARLVAENPNGRTPLIYGVTAEGRSGLVPNNLTTESEMAKSKSKKAAKPAAKRSTKARVLAADIETAKAGAGNGVDPQESADQRKADAAQADAPAAAVEAGASAPAEASTVEAAPAKPNKPGKGGKAAKPAKGKKAAKPAKGKKAAKAKDGRAERPPGKRAAILTAAQAGKLPTPPDFTADTHTRFRPKLAEVVAMAKARDLKGLKAFKYEGFLSSSPKAIMRYRELCIIALEAQRAR